MVHSLSIENRFWCGRLSSAVRIRENRRGGDTAPYPFSSALGKVENLMDLFYFEPSPSPPRNVPFTRCRIGVIIAGIIGGE